MSWTDLCRDMNIHSDTHMYVFHKALINTHTTGRRIFESSDHGESHGLVSIEQRKDESFTRTFEYVSSTSRNCCRNCSCRTFLLNSHRIESSNAHDDDTHTHRSESFQMQTRVMKIWAYQHLLTVRLQEADLLSKPWEHSL